MGRYCTWLLGIVVATFLTACGSGNVQHGRYPPDLIDEVEDWNQLFLEVDLGRREPFDLVDMAMSLGLDHRRALVYRMHSDTELLIPVYSRGLRLIAYEASEGQYDTLVAEIAERYGLTLFSTEYLPEKRRQSYRLNAHYYRSPYTTAVGDAILTGKTDVFALVLPYVAYSHGEGTGQSI